MVKKGREVVSADMEIVWGKPLYCISTWARQDNGSFYEEPASGHLRGLFYND